MKKWTPWLIATLILAVLMHFVALQRLPAIVTERMLANIFNYAEDWEKNKVNQLFHGKLRVAGRDKVPMDNPDTITSFGFFDVSEHPLRIHCVVPRLDSYWSLTLFSWNTDNFFVINDLQTASDTVEVVLKNAESSYVGQEGERVVVAPDEKGVILVRMILKDRSNQQEVDSITAIQQLAYAEVLNE